MSLIRFSLIYREGIGKIMVVFFEEYLFFYLRKEKKDVKCKEKKYYRPIDFVSKYIFILNEK